MVLKKRKLVLRACIRCILSYWEERFTVCSYRGFIFKGQARVSRNSRNFSGLIIRPEKFREFREMRASGAIISVISQKKKKKKKTKTLSGMKFCSKFANHSKRPAF